MGRLLADNFEQNPGAKLAIATEEVKQLTPDVKVTRGLATVTPADGAAETTRYTAVRVRKGDHWEISQLNERKAPPPNAYSKLEVLEWLLGPATLGAEAIFHPSEIKQSPIASNIGINGPATIKESLPTSARTAAKTGAISTISGKTKI
jgi:hypothetical protein